VSPIRLPSSMAPVARGDSLEQQILAAARLLREGEWTTYGDISAAVTGSVRAARAVALAAARSDDFPNAHRVLKADGTIARGAGPRRADRIARARMALEAEGVAFDPADRADPAARVHWDELAGRSDAPA
jgi:alkylated DNA nucleotide flippase Atl1